MIGYLFSLIKGRKYEKIGIWILSLISQWIHAFLVFIVMGACFPQLGYTGMSTFHMGINDALIALCCLFWVEVAYKIYHKERIQKYKDAVNQSLDDPYLSSKIVAISSGIGFLIICIAIFSTGYFANRSTYMLKQHRVHVTRTIEIDFLTGVMGRRLFLQHCQNIQSDQRIHGHQGWFLFLDVDWFKQINDKLGHIAGDETLKQFATFLQEQFEPYGAVGRVGGDEFAVMIEEEMSQEVLEKELEQFFQNISGIQKEVTVSCSIGVYRFTYPKTIKELLTKTDEILYEAKANGRGCFVIR